MFRKKELNYNEIINNLLVYFKNVEHKGIDPLTIFYSSKFLSLTSHKNKFIKRIKASFWSRSFNLFGNRLHFLLEPLERHYYVKGICLYLMAKINLDSFDEKDKMLLKKLDELKIPGAYLFSNPFTTYSQGKEFPPITPFVVGSYFAAELYFKLYNKYKQEEYLKYFKNIVNDLIRIIPIFTKNENEICFHYDTISKYFVHNANLLAVEMITKYNFLLGDHDKFFEYNLLIEKGLNYSLNDFRKTGTYYYAGEETRNKTIDNYHTGYILRSLNEINAYKNSRLKIDNLDNEINKLLDFYIATFVNKGFYIYRTELKTIETHSLAESILVYSTFNSKFDKKIRKVYLKKINKTLNLLYKGGKFINLTNTIFGIPFICDNSDYLRWSQAWILFGLSTLSNEDTNNV